jgi:hypothetical protein
MTIEQIKQNQVFEDQKALLWKTVEYRKERCVALWWEKKGMVPISQIADAAKVSTTELTLILQNDIARKTGVRITNQAPVISIQYTKEQIDAMYPNRRLSWADEHNLELFYYLVNKSERDAYPYRTK